MRSLELDPDALDDLEWWISKDRTQALRVMRLMQEILRDPFRGIGKPEPLRHDLQGCWSRRIDQENRVVYQVSHTKVRILGCRFHY